MPDSGSVPDAAAGAAPHTMPTGDDGVSRAFRKRRRWRRVLLALGPIAVIAVSGYVYLTGGRYQGTDNAYVQQSKVAISADIAGRVISVAVRENQTVKAGDTLFTLDPQPFQIALDQANAALASARVNVEQLRVAYGTARAKLAAAQSTLEIRQRELDRQNSLAKTGVSAAASLDNARIAFQAANSDVELDKQEVNAAIAALGGNPDIATDDHPAVRTALAAKESAERDLTKTTIVAPAPGVVSQVSSLNVGQFISTGTTIASLVETGDTWIEANYKETQLADLKVGQPAEVTVDAYPGVVFEGKVESIGAATGSEFSLIPAQNATGNWVKVVQRIPIRIALGPETSAEALRTGMSTVVSVDTGASTLDKMLGN